MKNLNVQLIHLTSVAENTDAALFVSGELYHSGCSLFGTEISIYDNDILVQKFVCCLNGFFYFKLNYEKQYKIVISKSELAPRTINFNTGLHGFPAEKKQYRFGITMRPIISSNLYTSDILTNVSVKFNYKTELFEHNIIFSEQPQKVA
jgi:hypothetical protein